MGCCFGQELRRFIFDGAPGENLYGIDISSQFIDLGYDLFLDRKKCTATFGTADVFHEPMDSSLQKVEGKVSIIYAGAFFHLFDRSKQLFIAKVFARLLKQRPGVMISGRQVGSINPGEYEHGTNSGGSMYRHNEQTWKDMWREVGEITKTQWDADVELRKSSNWPVGGLRSDDLRELRFCVKTK